MANDFGIIWNIQLCNFKIDWQYWQLRHLDYLLWPVQLVTCQVWCGCGHPCGSNWKYIFKKVGNTDSSNWNDTNMTCDSVYLNVTKMISIGSVGFAWNWWGCKLTTYTRKVIMMFDDDKSTALTEKKSKYHTLQGWAGSK